MVFPVIQLLGYSENFILGDTAGLPQIRILRCLVFSRVIRDSAVAADYVLYIKAPALLPISSCIVNF